MKTLCTTLSELPQQYFSKIEIKPGINSHLVYWAGIYAYFGQDKVLIVLVNYYDIEKEENCSNLN